MSVCPGLGTNTRAYPRSAAVRQAVSPLNEPARQDLRTAAREASTDAFHLAMFAAAGLLVAGAAVNLAIRNAPAPQRAESAAIAAE